MKQAGPKEFTGRHMFIIMVLFFGVIIAVNLTMATLASTSWSGLVVKNSYVASQQFNEKVEAARTQRALGWTPVLQFQPDLISFQMQGQSGESIPLEQVKMVLRHPVGEDADRELLLQRQTDGSFGTNEKIPDGVWIVETTARTGQHPDHFTTRKVLLPGGKVL
ncbi:MAG: FixH family protein [Rhizobiaceae bacterium]